MGASAPAIAAFSAACSASTKGPRVPAAEVLPSAARGHASLLPQRVRVSPAPGLISGLADATTGAPAGRGKLDSTTATPHIARPTAVPPGRSMNLCVGRSAGGASASLPSLSRKNAMLRTPGVVLAGEPNAALLPARALEATRARDLRRAHPWRAPHRSGAPSAEWTPIARSLAPRSQPGSPTA